MKYSLFIVIIGCLLSCKSTSQAPIDKDEVMVMKEGQLHGAGQEGFEKGHQLIRNQVDFQAFMNKMNQQNTVLTSQLAQKVDFDKSIVVAIFDKVRPSGGYSINLQEVNSNDGKVVLKTKIRNPQGMATSVMSQPYLLLKMPKTDNDIEVK